MVEHEVWECERRLWLDTTQFYKEHVAPGALVDQAARKHPCWTSVSFSDRRSSFPSVDTALLAYRARAEGESSTQSLQACCSSTYVRVRRSWMLVAHQRSVVGREHELSANGALQLFFADPDRPGR
jgi:hypothetical protein